MGVAYSSFLSSSFPLFFKSIDSALIDENNKTIYFSKEARQSKMNPDEEYSNKSFFKLEPITDCKAKISWFILPALLIIVNFVIVGLYASYGSFSIVEQAGMAALSLAVIWSSYLSIQPFDDNKKIDFLILLVVGIIAVLLSVYSFMNANIVLFISSSIISFNMIVFMEAVKPILLILAQDSKQCYLFGDDKKFILIMEKKNVN